MAPATVPAPMSYGAILRDCQQQNNNEGWGCTPEDVRAIALAELQGQFSQMAVSSVPQPANQASITAKTQSLVATIGAYSDARSGPINVFIARFSAAYEHHFGDPAAAQWAEVRGVLMQVLNGQAFTELEAATVASYAGAVQVLCNHFGKMCKQCLSALMHLKKGTQPLASFLDSFRDLAHDGSGNADIVISVLQNALAPAYAALLAEKTAHAAACKTQLT